MLAENPKNNRLPENINHIHLMGICGTGMGSLAGMLKEQGFLLTGSDQAVYPPMSTFLSTLGIPIREGYSPSNLTPPPDLVIVGNVITRINPEAQELIRLGLPYLSLPQALAHFFLKNRRTIVITGTHGKTTTSALLASVWIRPDFSGFMIGGILKGYERNYQVGQGTAFVIKGDEYDTAFFDKGPKLLHYQPYYSVLTSIEFDHADIYQDLQSIQEAFARFLALIPEEGLLSAYGPDPRIREILPKASCPVETYGLEDNWDWQLTDLKIDRMGAAFSVFYRREFFHSFRIPLAGRHNALNCLSLIPVLCRLGLGPEQIAQGLSSFQGVHRASGSPGHPGRGYRD